jgi:hypothetical protein
MSTTVVRPQPRPRANPDPAPAPGHVLENVGTADWRLVMFGPSRSRMVSSEMSVGTLEAFFGQGTHSTASAGALTASTSMPSAMPSLAAGGWPE